MKCQATLLLKRLGFNEPYIWKTGGLADGLGINRIVLLSFDVKRNVLPWTARVFIRAYGSFDPAYGSTERLFSLLPSSSPIAGRHADCPAERAI